MAALQGLDKLGVGKLGSPRGLKEETDVIRFVPSLHFKIFAKTQDFCVQYCMDIKPCNWRRYHLNKAEGRHKEGGCSIGWEEDKQAWSSTRPFFWNGFMLAQSVARMYYFLNHWLLGLKPGPAANQPVVNLFQQSITKYFLFGLNC